MEEDIPFLDIEIKLINSCTDLTPDKWIAIYAARFREIVESDPTLTEYQIRHALYLQK
jgi:hypothetical protein